jgi:cobalt/nickel transport system ATP-binding protein
LRDRAPHRLSGGEKKRVALASVLSLDPEVWLMDEPAAGLDPRSHDWLVEFLARQASAGKTIVTATHDLAVVPNIADRVLVLGEDHRVAAEGAVTQILSDRDLLIACNLLGAGRYGGITLPAHAAPAERP